MASTLPENSYLDRTSVFLLLQVIFISIMLHASLGSDFYDYDDKYFIASFTQDKWENTIWPSTIPVTVLSFKAEETVFKNFIAPEVRTEKPDEIAPPKALAPPMRTMNAVYQIIAGLLLWHFLRRIHAGAGAAFMVALLWTAHPMNCENVSWIIERKSILCALFGFGALLAWTARAWWRLPLMNLLLALSFGSKPAALGLLPLFVLLELFTPINPLPFNDRRRWLNMAAAVAGPIVISVLMTIPVLRAFKTEIIDPPGGSVWTALLTDVEVFARYIHHTLFPFRLSFFYSVIPIVSLADSRLLIYGLPVIVLLGGMVWATEREKRPLAIFGILWFFAALGPNSNLVAIVFWMQDRYAVLSIPGLLLATILATHGILKRVSANPQWLPRLGTAYILMFAGLLAYRAGYYKNGETLELDAAEHQPTSAIARMRAARIYSNEMKKFEPGSPSADPALYKKAARLALFHLEGVEHCPDHTNFRDPFDTRLAIVELLGELGMNAEVKKLLVGWLPPAHLKMFPVKSMSEAYNLSSTRRTFSRGYMPQTLARAWAVTAECSYRLSADPKLSEVEQRTWLERALKESDQSLAVPASDESARLVKAKVLFQLARLDARKSPVEAQKKYDTAVELLVNPPQDWLWKKEAQQILDAARANAPL